MKQINKQSSKKNDGSLLAFAAIAILLLSILGIGILRMAYGAKVRAINIQYETVTRLAAEAGYEASINWMSSLDDVPSNLLVSIGAGGRTGQRASGSRAIEHKIKSNPDYFSTGTSFNSKISFKSFLGSRPVYQITSDGFCSRGVSTPSTPQAALEFQRNVDASMVQKIGGWDIGVNRRPDGSMRINEKDVFFSRGDVIDMPIHINCDADPDPAPEDQYRDIYVSGLPLFTQKVCMGESRYWRLGGNKDKYGDVMRLFKGGIYFDQPDSGITHNAYKIEENISIKERVNRFVSTTKSNFIFNPVADSNSIVDGQPAVQLEFYIKVQDGMVKITDNCTVKCRTNGGPYDYKLAVNDAANDYIKSDIYEYHYVDSTASPVTIKIADSYVEHVIQTMSGDVIKSDSGGQIFVNGNVIIAGALEDNGKINVGGKKYSPLLKGRITVVATGNIWITNSVVYDGKHDEIRNMDGFLIKKVPMPDNPNILALFSQNGVVQIVDPNLSASGPPEYPGILDYSPIGYQDLAYADPNIRQLPQAMVVQAAITAGGGGWGVENVGLRKNTNPNGKDNLIVAGTICEVFRGVVAEDEASGFSSDNGYQKYYYFDERLVNGIFGRTITYGIPGDMWLQRKYIPIQGGWTDSRL